MHTNTNTTIQIKINYKPWLTTVIIIFSDILSLFAAFFVPFLLRKVVIPFVGGVVTFSMISPMLWVLFGLVVILFTAKGLYPGDLRTGVTELKDIISAITIAYITTGVTIYLFGIGELISRFVFLASWVFACTFVFLSRVFVHNRFSLFTWWSRPVVVIGMEKDISDAVARLQHARRMAIKPVAILITGESIQETEICDIPVYVNTQEKQNELRKAGISLAVYVSHSGETTKKQKEQLHSISLAFPKLIYVLTDTPLNTLAMTPIDLEGRPALKVQYNLLSPTSIIVKRILDLIICFLIFFFAFPIFLFLSFLIRLDSPGPIIYRQKRIGKNGQIFEIFKFRTMFENAEAELENILSNDENLRDEYRNFHKFSNDPRITRIGRFLRKSSLDELPQLWNVIRGEMNLIGPRAYLPSELNEMGEYANIITRVAPGLTGWWQVMGRHSVGFNSRLTMDEYYISNFSLWMDLFIFVKTFWIVFTMKGL